MATTPAQKTAAEPGLKRSLSVWQAVGLSLALMAPSMAANINPQGAALAAGRAVPLAFLIAAVGVLFVAYTFVRLCQYYRHSGSVYAFVGATLGPRAGVIAGWGLAGTYVFYAVVTAAAAGIFGAGLLDSLGIWKNQPAWAPMLVVGIALALALVLAALPARGGTNVLLDRGGVHGRADPHRHRGRARPAADGGRAGWFALHLERVQPAAGDRRVRAVPRRGVRLPVVRGVRGVVHAWRGDAQPVAGHPAGDPWRGRSSAASTSWSSRRRR